MSILIPGMKGELICLNCKTYYLKVLYVRISVTPEGVEFRGRSHYGEGRRKQKFERIGCYCEACGAVFFDEPYFKKVMEARKEHRKYWSDFPKGKVAVKKFVKFTKDYNGNITKVEIK